MTKDNRYQRQILLPQIGSEGQRALAESHVLLVGCGALGSVIAEQLVRAGVGHLRIVDRDIVELSNLQRQVLFDESDASEGLPKSVAAAKRLHAINSEVEVESLVADLDAHNAEELAKDSNLILDGTDNVETRYLLNDVAVKHHIPWIYGGCVGTEGRVATFVSNKSACLRCMFPAPPAPGELPTCDTAGVLGPVAGVVGSLQSIAAIKLLSGNAADVVPELLSLNLWSNQFQRIDLSGAKNPKCPTCGLREFSLLNARSRDVTVRLCGRNAVQVRPAAGSNSPSLSDTAARLRSVGSVTVSPFLVRCALPEELSLTIFADGRAIVSGTNDPGRARSVYARYIGA